MVDYWLSYEKFERLLISKIEKINKFQDLNLEKREIDYSYILNLVFDNS